MKLVIDGQEEPYEPELQFRLTKVPVQDGMEGIVLEYFHNTACKWQSLVWIHSDGSVIARGNPKLGTLLPDGRFIRD